MVRLVMVDELVLSDVFSEGRAHILLQLAAEWV